MATLMDWAEEVDGNAAEFLENQIPHTEWNFIENIRPDYPTPSDCYQSCALAAVVYESKECDRAATFWKTVVDAEDTDGDYEDCALSSSSSSETEEEDRGSSIFSDDEE